MNIIKMITKKKCYIGQNNPAYIVIHETDNWSKGADAKAHATAMRNGNLGTVHYYVDSKSIYQTLEHQDGAYAVGDGGGKYGITNRNSINIEICVNPESNYYKAVDKAEKLAAHLLNLYGFPIGCLVRHYDASRKHCPRRIIDEGKWDDFVKKTAVYMGMSAGVPDDKYYRIRKSWEDSKSQIGAYKSLDNAKRDWKAGYTIFDWSGKAVYPEAATEEKTDLSKAISVQFPEIKKGNTGSGVRVLQAVLRIEVDGSFGDNTEKALNDFQKKQKLTADGICGANTWKEVVKHLQENTFI